MRDTSKRGKDGRAYVLSYRCSVKHWRMVAGIKQLTFREDCIIVSECRACGEMHAFNEEGVEMVDND